METKAGKPAAANEVRKILRALMQHAIQTGLRDNDPTRDVKPVKIKGDGFHSWTEEEIAQFEAKHPVGTKARLALGLLVNVGQRRGDTILMGRQHVRNGFIAVDQGKTGAKLEIPITEDLQAIIAATPCDNLTFLTTDRGNRPSPGRVSPTGSESSVMPPAFSPVAPRTACARPAQGDWRRPDAARMRSRR